MASNQVNDLGSATGRIIIDVSSLKDAAAVVQSFAQQTMAALAPIADVLKDLATIATANTAVIVAQYQMQAAAAQAAAEVQVSANELAAQASADATKVLVQDSKERAAALNDEADAATSAADAQGSLTSPGARGISRAAFSVGLAARTLGMNGVAQAATGVGAFTALIGEIPVFTNQISAMAAQLLKTGGVFGQLAQLGSSVAVALGASAGGVAASFAALAAVALPIVAVIALLVAAMQAVETNFQHAATEAQNYIDKQDKINQLVASGATGSDVSKDVATKQVAFDATKASMDALEPLMDIIRRAGVLPQVTQAAQDNKGAELLSGFLPGIQGVNDQIKAASQGQFSDANALVQAYIKLSAELQTNATAVGNTAAAAGDAGIATNTLNAAFNDVGTAAIDAAKLTYQLSQMTAQQLQQKLNADQAEADSIQQNGALLTGKQYDAAVARLDQLDKEKALIQSLLPAAYLKNLQDFGVALRNLVSTTLLQDTRTAQDRQIADANKLQDAGIAQSRRSQDQALQRLQQVEDFDKQQERAQEDYLTAQGKAQQQYNQQEQQAEADQQDKLLKITQNARLDILKAAAELDARAVYQDQQKRDQALADAADSFKTQQSRTAEQYAQQQADQQAQFDLQRQRALADFQETQQRQADQQALQQRRQQEDFTLQRQRQDAQYALQDQRRLEDDAKQLATLVQHNQVIQSLFGLGLAGLQQQIATFWSKVNGGASPIGTATNQIGQVIGSILNPSHGGAVNLLPYQETIDAGGMLPPAFDSGGINLFPGLFYSGKPEAHIPLSQMAGMGGDVHLHGDVIIGDIGNRTDDEVIQLMERGFRAILGKGMARFSGATS